jgi:hypothetical protein
VAGSGSKRSSSEKVPGGQSAPEALVADGDSKAYQQTSQVGLLFCCETSSCSGIFPLRCPVNEEQRNHLKLFLNQRVVEVHWRI